MINPAGIIFGENARLDIGGSFYGSSASSILFEDGEFSAADLTNPPVLTINAPIGLGFRDNPGDIVNRSRGQNIDEAEVIGLKVNPGNNLVFLGGNLNLEGGNLTASGGNIYLGGLIGAGIVNLKEDGSLNFPDDITLANISLTNAAGVDVIGVGGGNITVDAHNLTLEANELSRSSISGGISRESTNPEAQAGDIIINVAEDIRLVNSDIDNNVQFSSVGNSGNIVINTGSLELTNDSQVRASTFGQGNAGAIDITATGDITIDGESSDVFSLSGVFSLSEEEGNTGGITISTNNLSLTNRGQVRASAFFGQGNVGAIDIVATGDITIDGESGIISSSDGEGDTGRITISTNNLNLTNGGQVQASSLFFGQGNAGVIDVVATEDITIDGESGIISSSDGEGNTGGITISTNNLNLTNGGQVRASVFFGQGNVGAIDITASSDITVDGQGLTGFSSGIFSLVNRDAFGNVGNINLSTVNLNLTNGGQISAETRGESNAGDVNISSDNLKLENLNSGIFSRTGGIGSSGTVDIDTANLQIEDNAQVAVNNFVETN